MDDVLPQDGAAARRGDRRADDAASGCMSATSFAPRCRGRRTRPPSPRVRSRETDLPADLGGDAFEVRHQGELLGALTISLPPNDPMNPTKERLARDMAAQAGLVLRNVALDRGRAGVPAPDRDRAGRTGPQARAGHPRRRAAAARGAVGAAATRPTAGRPGSREGAGAPVGSADAGRPRRSRTSATSRVGSTRPARRPGAGGGARGAGPPLLARRRGPPRRRRPVPSGRGVRRVLLLPRGAQQRGEVRRCVTRRRSDWRATDGELRFEVADDGRGFDRSVTSYGTGLQGMADRLDAIGGSIEVDSAPGAGDEGGRTPPGRRRATMTRRWPWIVWALTLVLAVITFTLSATTGSFSEDPFFLSVAMVMIVGYMTIGALIASRTERNPIGWLLMVDRGRLPPRGVHGRIPALRPPARTGRRRFILLLGVAHELGLRSRRVPGPLDPLALPRREAAHAPMEAGRDRDRDPRRDPAHRHSILNPGPIDADFPGPLPHEPHRRAGARGRPRSDLRHRWPRPPGASVSPRSARWCSGTDGPSGRSASRCAGSSRPSGSRPRC